LQSRKFNGSLLDGIESSRNSWTRHRAIPIGAKSKQADAQTPFFCQKPRRITSDVWRIDGAAASDERRMPFAGEIIGRRRFGGQAALQGFNERGRLARRPVGPVSDLKRAPAALQ
jgi:hypothetical protein